MQTLGKRFKHLRKLRHLTQDQLAHLSQAGRSTVSALESGEPLKLDTVYAIAKPLKLSQAELLSLVIDWFHCTLVSADLGHIFTHLTIRANRTGETSDMPTQLLLTAFSKLPPERKDDLLDFLGRPCVEQLLPLIRQVQLRNDTEIVKRKK